MAYVLGPLGPLLHSGASVVPQSVQIFGSSDFSTRFFDKCY